MSAIPADVAEVLDGFTPIDSVPAVFAEFMADRVGRPAPEPVESEHEWRVRVESKLDEILTLLRGGSREASEDG